MTPGMPARRFRRYLGAGAISWLVAGLAACGGGSGEASGASAVEPMSFAAAPALGPAPTPLPRSSGVNVCDGYRFGSRDIENLSVPDGARCVLDRGVVVDGNVELGDRSELYAQGVRVGGNVQGQRAAAVVLETSTVAGNVQLDIGGAITLRDNAIGGSIQLVANGAAVHVLGNVVDSDIQLFDNVAGVWVSDNTVDGNLQCKQNQPVPMGGGNRVQGNKEDQCAPL